jgi:hypothetical protein
MVTSPVCTALITCTHHHASCPLLPRLARARRSVAQESHTRNRGRFVSEGDDKHPLYPSNPSQSFISRIPTTLLKLPPPVGPFTRVPAWTSCHVEHYTKSIFDAWNEPMYVVLCAGHTSNRWHEDPHSSFFVSPGSASPIRKCEGNFWWVGCLVPETRARKPAAC